MVLGLNWKKQRKSRNEIVVRISFLRYSLGHKPDMSQDQLFKLACAKCGRINADVTVGTPIAERIGAIG